MRDIVLLHGCLALVIVIMIILWFFFILSLSYFFFLIFFLKVSETGHFFHIDFAHILGAKLKFVGFERETAPFIFTKEFLRVMGGNFLIILCCFNYFIFYFILKNHSR